MNFERIEEIMNFGETMSIMRYIYFMMLLIMWMNVDDIYLIMLICDVLTFPTGTFNAHAGCETMKRMVQFSCLDTW